MLMEDPKCEVKEKVEFENPDMSLVWELLLAADRLNFQPRNTNSSFGNQWLGYT